MSSTTSSSITSTPRERDTSPEGRTIVTGPQESALHTSLDTNAAVSYTQSVAKRRRLLSPSKDSVLPEAFEPVLTFAHGAAVNTCALPSGSGYLYTGCQDGYIRRYALLDSLNGKAFAGNLLSKPTVEVLPGAPNPIVVSYFENADPDEVVLKDGKDRVSRAKFGPRSIGEAQQKAGNYGVHSLVVQQDELFALAGSETGAINLLSVRLDEGHIRHSFTPEKNSSIAHKPEPISALALHPDETSFCSGGWDRKVLQWDLNTGQCTRSFEGATNQITSLSFRPLSSPSDPSQTEDPTVNKADSERENSYDPLFDEGDETKPPEQIDQGVSSMSSDVLLGTGVNGQALLWDRRAEGNAALELRIGASTPPWTMQGIWSPDGQKVMIGRRNASIDVYDLRNPQCQTLRLPPASGPVTALAMMPDQRHLVCGSNDVIRLWDLQDEDSKKLGYKVAATAHSGPISSLNVDYKGRFIVAAIGNRGFSKEVGQVDGVIVSTACSKSLI